MMYLRLRICSVGVISMCTNISAVLDGTDFNTTLWMYTSSISYHSQLLHHYSTVYNTLNQIICILVITLLDVKVPDDGSVSDRAEKTLPNGLFLAPTTTGDKTVRGVFAGMHLKKGATFGPYQGEIVTDWEKSKESR